MIEKLQYLFFPNEGNNHKPKILHLSSLSLLVIFIGVFQLGLAVLTQVSPGVLGDIADISPGRIVDLTNERRRAQGLPALEIDPLLVNAARAKAADMFTLDYWSHNSPQGKKPWWFFNNVGYNYIYAGENLARDFSNADSVVQAWMNSPTHKENILNNDYRDIGIAIVDGVLNGQKTTLVVQMFGTKVNPVSEVADNSQTAEESVAAPNPVETSQTETTVRTEKEANQSTDDLQPVEEEPEQESLEESLQDPEVYLSEAKGTNFSSTKGTFISDFLLTKELSLILIGVVLVALIIDVAFISNKNIVRISGKSFVHLLFFAVILIIILFSSQGRIL
jgi:hypothetical protein